MSLELQLGDTGAYGELRTRPNPAGHALVFIPALVALLERGRGVSGGDLSMAESRRIRDAAVVIALPPEMAREGAEERGYEDVDPESLDADDTA
jgi:hypothetical protein